MKTDDEVPEVLPGDHAVGVLANQHEVWLEGPAAETDVGMKTLRLDFCSSNVMVDHPLWAQTEEWIAEEIS